MAERKDTINLERKTGEKDLRWTLTGIGILGLGIILLVVTLAIAIRFTNAETEFLTHKESVEKQIAELKEKLSTYETMEVSKTYTTEELVDLCIKGDYDSLLKVCMCQDASAEILAFAAKKIGDNQYSKVYETLAEKAKKLNKLEMLILDHPNCTKSVLIQLMGIDNDQFMPILITSERNDSGTLMLFAEICRTGRRHMEWIALIANHEAATESVIKELMTIADIDEISNMLQERLNELQGK